MSQQQTRNDHHFTPKGLLRPWRWPDNLLRGYWWDVRRQEMRCKTLGVDGFGYQLHLLTLHSRKKLPDVLEREFARIDNDGCAARDVMLAHGIGALSAAQRLAFARLLMSLMNRNPEAIIQMRSMAMQARLEFDNDQAILRAARREGVEGPPSEYIAGIQGLSIEDRLFSNTLTTLRDNFGVATRLANAHWRLMKLKDGEGSFVLRDRPLTCNRGPLSHNPDWFWGLPLTPRVMFVVAGSKDIADGWARSTARQLQRLANTPQGEVRARFIFVADKSHEHWLGKYIRRWSENIDTSD